MTKLHARHFDSAFPLILAIWLGVGCEPMQVGISRGADTQGGQSTVPASGAGSSVYSEFGGAEGAATGGSRGITTPSPRGGASNMSAGGGYTAASTAGGAATGGASNMSAGGGYTAASTAGGAATGGASNMSAGGGYTAASTAGGAATGGASNMSAGGGYTAASTAGGAATGGAASGGTYGGGAGSYAGAGIAGWAASAGVGGAAPSCTNGSLEIRGHVLSPRGVPLPGVHLTLTGQTNGTTTTDAKGEYVFSQVCPGANVLTPSREGLRFCNDSATFANLTKNVDEDFAGSQGGCVAPEILQRLGIVVFDPLVDDGRGTSERLSKVMGWQDPLELAEQYRRAIETETNGRVRYELVSAQVVEAFPQKADGFNYTEASYRQCLAAPATSCHLPDAADYLAISVDQGLCKDINNGAIDEVWLFGGPYFGFPLLQRMGPQKLATSSPWLLIGTGCGRVTNVFGFSYERGLDVMLGGLHGQGEFILAQLYGGWNPDNAATNYNRFALVDETSPSLTMSGCGGHGYAPNSSLVQEYDSTRLVNSYCDDFYDFPMLSDMTAVAKPTNCEAWGCSAMGYYRYWLRHLPAAKGTAADGLLADWWRYLLRPDDAMATSRVTCSSSFATGWCENVTDTYHGECNSSEWATSHRSTGWVEFSWFPPKTVHSVAIYDRACDEHVVRGHLELSDASTNITFGELENLGNSPTTIAFPSAKELAWLRVVIDESEGGDNPGFGEIGVE